ncbi:GNAT family N-acetyltransferase [Kitasatospora cystarginea]|uniref:GNAT family N-acetyltransferase n=1 Tax=Kitasatospora cystarginea TaxID=58350 RepID=A0ABN3DR89_9ACTN
MIIRAAQERDFTGFLDLAAQVEHWFGPMVGESGFHRAVRKHTGRATALVAVPSDGGPGPLGGPGALSRPGLLGGLLFGGQAPVHHVHWLVVAEHARRQGVGRALMAEALRRIGPLVGSVDVVTFGAGHPGAVTSGARVFCERLGFAPAETAEPGPEGGSRQVYRLAAGRPGA